MFQNFDPDTVAVSPSTLLFVNAIVQLANLKDSIYKSAVEYFGDEVRYYDSQLYDNIKAVETSIVELMADNIMANIEEQNGAI